MENKALDIPEGIPRAACDRAIDATTRRLDGRGMRRDGYATEEEHDATEAEAVD